MSWTRRETTATRGGWSIAGRLTVLYGVTTAGVLLLSVGVLDWALARRLLAQDVEEAREEIQEVREILAEGAAAPGSEILREASVKGVGRYLVRVEGGGGGPGIETAAMAARVPRGAFPEPRGPEPVWRAWRAADGRPYLLMAAPASSRGGPRLVQVALDRSREAAVASDYRRLLLAVLLGGVLISTTAGVFLTRRGLAPLRAITRTAARIDAERLAARVGGRTWPAELRELATVFDGMLDRLEESFLRLSRFSADLAHELRTPVGNLMGEVEVALGRERSPAAYRAVLESALEECGRLAALIDSLLFLARAESGRAALALEGRELGAEAAEVCDYYAAAAEEKGVALTCSGRATADVDPLLLRRVLDNLLANALAHTEAGGQVEMRVERAAEGARVTVRDTGCGVAAEHLPRLFDRFYRAEPSRSGGRGGSGLGLALVRSIVEMHGGRVSLRSRPGEGTTAEVLLPPSRMGG